MKTILTHDGPFHTDEVVAIAMLRIAFAKEHVRSRRSRTADPDDPMFDLIVDIGGKYDGTRYFDHHQLNGPVRPTGEAYAASGLIWKHFHPQIIQMIIPSIDPADIDTLFQDIDRGVMIHLDKADNGKSVPAPLTIHQMVSCFNTTWDVNDSAVQSANFQAVVALITEWFVHTLQQAYSKISARGVLQKALQGSDPRYVVLPTWIPFRTLLFEMPQTMLYAVYPGSNEIDWRIEALPIVGSMVSRKALPEAWYGLTEAELEQACGIPGAKFCHKTGFMASAHTRDAAMAMLQEALK